MSTKKKHLGLLAAWSMAVGGMIGGGMFATLGIMFAIAGGWAWTSFVMAGLLAAATGYSYTVMSRVAGKRGGLYRFLLASGHRRAAALALYLLTGAYVLSMAVYAYTFGAYVAAVAGSSSGLQPALAAGSILATLVVNLRGAGQATRVEVAAVCVKLVILYAVAATGWWNFEVAELRLTAPDGVFGVVSSIALGSATVFMAFQGFQLLAYDYDDIRNPERNFPRAVQGAIVATTLTYVVVAIGGLMLIGMQPIVEQQEISLATMGRGAFGQWGFYLVILAAALATITAINATLFATARLVNIGAAQGQWPNIGKTASLSGQFVALAAAALALALLGGLDSLVRWASLLFLACFALVNLFALRQGSARRWISLAGMVGTFAAMILLALHLAGIV